MKFTLSWLKDHLDTSASLQEIADKLVSLGLEVEGIEDPAENLKGFVIAEVVECGRHPNADRLSLCYADAGTGERIQVVCGASNVRTGMKVAFAPVGVTIPSTGTVLKKGKIRDIESLGMFCSSEELGMSDQSDGILDLDSSLKPGTPLADALGLVDPVIDIAITPNRSDCFGVRGIARDLAASGLGKLKELPYKPTKGTFAPSLTVTINDTEGCPDFQYQIIKGVRNGPSPDWVQHRLKAIGLRPISALVDVTNYLTFDLGRPLHVFDMAKVKGNLTIRKATAGEKLAALNDKEYTLEDGMVVIADDTGVISLGGIIGGASTGCTNDTVDVIIECAIFDPVRTAHTGRRLSVLTDARTRFERGIDINSLRPGLDAATQLIQKWCGGTASENGLATNRVSPQPLPSITLTKDKLKSLSGYEIPWDEAKNYLEALNFTIQSSDSTSLTVLPPSYRPDIEGPADLVEEILRLKGYDQIPAIPLPHSTSSPSTSIPSITKRALAARGLNEAVTWSFMEESLAKQFGGGDPTLRIAHPISNEMSDMRPSILPNLIQAAIRNQDRTQHTIELFEVGPQYEPQNQQLMATGLLAGQTGSRHWAQAPRPLDIFDAKSHLLAVLQTLGISESALQIKAEGPSYYHPGRKGTYKQGNKVLAQFGEIHPSIITDLKGDGAFIGFEIFLNNLPPLKVKKSTLNLSQYQPVMRDFAFVVDDHVPADDIIKTISKVDRDLITDIQIFDVYKGEKLEKNKKSLAIQVRLEPQSGTLTDSQITELCDKIVAQVSKTTGGTLRAS